jgi:hypothetical protein
LAFPKAEIEDMDETVSHRPQGLLQVRDRNKPSLSRLYLASILAYPSALFREKFWFMAFIYCFFSISKEGLAVLDVRRETHL